VRRHLLVFDDSALKRRTPYHSRYHRRPAIIGWRSFPYDSAYCGHFVILKCTDFWRPTIVRQTPKPVRQQFFSILDRPVLDKTGLTKKYDFDLEWTYDDTQFGGNLPPLAAQTSAKPIFFQPSSSSA
jgi:hypothetical protein